MYPMAVLFMLASTLSFRVPQISHDVRLNQRRVGAELARDAGGAVDHAGGARLQSVDFFEGVVRA